jgi:hypothetical protein
MFTELLQQVQQGTLSIVRFIQLSFQGLFFLKKECVELIGEEMCKNEPASDVSYSRVCGDLTLGSYLARN